MRRTLCLAALIASGCAQHAEVSVLATFGGKSCAEAGVDHLAFGILGVGIGNTVEETVLTCAQAGSGAISLGRYPAGSYNIAVTGYDYASDAIYASGNQEVQVESGAVTFNLDAPTATGTATFNWTFGGQTCAQAGITTVTATVQGVPYNGLNGSSALPCTAGGVDASSLVFFSSNDYKVTLFAQGSNGNAWSGSATAIVNIGQDTPVTLDLPGASPRASAQVTWQFSGGKSCKDVGVDFITVMSDLKPAGTDGTVLAQTACVVDGQVITAMTAYNIPDGDHPVGIVGFKSREVIYVTPTPANQSFSAPARASLSVDAEYHPLGPPPFG
jgi:hypothetical protein